MNNWPDTISISKVDHRVVYAQAEETVWVAVVEFVRDATGYAHLVSEQVDGAVLVTGAGIGEDQNEAFDALGTKICEMMGNFMNRPASSSSNVFAPYVGDQSE